MGGSLALTTSRVANVLKRLAESGVVVNKSKIQLVQYVSMGDEEQYEIWLETVKVLYTITKGKESIHVIPIVEGW